jgi:hypothetical protein
MQLATLLTTEEAEFKNKGAQNSALLYIDKPFLFSASSVVNVLKFLPRSLLYQV